MATAGVATEKVATTGLGTVDMFPAVTAGAAMANVATTGLTLRLRGAVTTGPGTAKVAATGEIARLRGAVRTGVATAKVAATGFGVTEIAPTVTVGAATENSAMTASGATD